jgi:hypothetical protein
MDVEPAAGELAMDHVMTGSGEGVDDTSEDELDAEGDAGVRIIIVPVVVMTAGSPGAASSTTKSAGSPSCSAGHAHYAASSKMTSQLMWTHRVVGS